MKRLQSVTLELGDPPLMDFVNRHGIEVMQFLTALSYRDNKIGLFEQDKVLGHCLPCHVQVFAQRPQSLPVVGVKLAEEPGLVKRFGDYLTYKRNVPRWIPRVAYDAGPICCDAKPARHFRANDA